MRKMKRFLTVLLTAGMVTALPGATALAADTTSGAYTYKITVYAGNVGEFEGGSVSEGTLKDSQTYEITGKAYKSSVTLYDIIQDATPTDDKYYVMGVRLAGRDNLEEDAANTNTVDASAFKVTEDADYVIAYGIKGDMVAYTVNYVDESGNALLESDTFYGNVGDKPVAAYRYVDGYTPDTLAITKTLSDNEAENVFTFTYSPGEMPTTTVVTTTTTQTAGTVAGGGTAAGNAAAGNAAGGDNTAEAGTDADAGTEEDLTELEEEETPTDLTDLDEIEDEETPAANNTLSEDVAKGLPLAGGIAIAAAAAAGLVTIGTVTVRRRKGNK